MTDIKISTILEFMKALDEDTIVSKGVPLMKARIYRGVPDSKHHELIPSIGRGWTGDKKPLLGLEKRNIGNVQETLSSLSRLSSHERLGMVKCLDNIMDYKHVCSIGRQTHLLLCILLVLMKIIYRWMERYIIAEAKSNSFSNVLRIFQFQAPLKLRKIISCSHVFISPRIAAQASAFTISKNPLSHCQLS